MWVVYNSQTGVEYDTYWSETHARYVVGILNDASDEDEYTFRKED